MKVNSWLPMRMMVAVGQRGAAPDTPALHIDAIGRLGIVDDETGSGIDDYGVVPADVSVVVENDVVVRMAPDPGGRAVQWILTTGSVAQPGDGEIADHAMSDWES